MIPFKCDLNQKLVLTLFEKLVDMDMDTPPLSFHINIPWWVWKNVLICWVISRAFSPASTGWCRVSVWGNNLGMQVTKPILISTACEGLLNCMLCSSWQVKL